MSKKQFFDNLKNYMNGLELDKFKSGIVTWLTHGFHLVILVVAMVLAFLGGRYYSDVYSAINVKDKNFTTIQTMDKTSISITDRNELMILNRYTGQVTLFSDTCGYLIQKMYSEKREVVAKIPDVKTKK